LAQFFIRYESLNSIRLLVWGICFKFKLFNRQLRLIN